MLKIAAAGGGTAGHLYPLLSILETFQKYESVEILFFAVRGKIDEKVVKNEHPSYIIRHLNARGLSRPLWKLENFKKTVKYIKEINRIRKELKKFKPDIVISTGGYSGGLLSIATKGKYPLFIHEQNAKPGLANLKSAKFAKKIFVSFDVTVLDFPSKFRDKIIVTGNPIRETTMFKRDVYGVPNGVILVIGGSLGSEFLNSLMEKVYEMDRKNFYVHSTGSKNWTIKLSRYKNVLTYDYIDFMPVIWRKARFVISRAGATTVSEMIRYKVKGILIPWEASAENHQMLNALQAEEAGFATVIREKDASPRIIYEYITHAEKIFSLPSENPAYKVYRIIVEEIK